MPMANVGKLVAKYGKGFGMDVYAFDPFVDKGVMERMVLR